jgi:ribosomal-protein-alanine N-acetyltransferase
LRVDDGLRIRPGALEDLAAVSAIQELCPEAAQWTVSDYLGYEFRVAEIGARVAGFLVSRTLSAGEREILNMAVTPFCRRQGVARGLLQSLLEEPLNSVFLEVRESNQGARYLYKSMGFQEVSVRREYYQTPDGLPESAIVMKFHSC